MIATRRSMLDGAVLWRSAIADVGAEWLADASGYSKGQRATFSVQRRFPMGNFSVTLLADAICDGVRQQEWAIEHAANADTAKAALLNHAYSVIVLDIGLPGASGLSVLRWMRERYDATPVLIITARG